jgi:hypothetical protein
MNWPDTILVTALASIAVIFFARAAWLHHAPAKPDGCWLKPPRFQRRTTRKTGTKHGTKSPAQQITQ